MRAVASRCGVAPMSLYRFVEDKDDLVTRDGRLDLRLVRRSTATRAPRGGPKWSRWRGSCGDCTARTPGSGGPSRSPGRSRCRTSSASATASSAPSTDSACRRNCTWTCTCCCSATSLGLAANFEAEDEAISETGLSSQEWTDLQYLPRTGDSAFMVDVPHFAKLFGELRVPTRGLRPRPRRPVRTRPGPAPRRRRSAEPPPQGGLTSTRPPAPSRARRTRASSARPLPPRRRARRAVRGWRGRAPSR